MNLDQSGRSVLLMEQGARVTPLEWALADLVRQYMGSRGWSRDDAGHHFGMSGASVRRYFQECERSPDVGALERVARVLGFQGLSGLIERAEKEAAHVTQQDVDRWLELDRRGRKEWRIPSNDGQDLAGVGGQAGAIIARAQSGLADDYRSRAGLSDDTGDTQEDGSTTEVRRTANG